MGRRSEHSQEQIREMVLAAAEAIVIEEGFPGLTVRKIALEIGYTVGSIYMVFTNMTDLVMQIKGRTLDMLATELDQVPAALTPERQIHELFTVYTAFAHRHFNRWSMIFEHRLPDNQALPDAYQNKIDPIFTRLEDLLLRLQADRSRQQRQLAARTLWSGVHGICILSLSGKLDRVGVHQTHSSVELLVDTFIRGWQAACD